MSYFPKHQENLIIVKKASDLSGTLSSVVMGKAPTPGQIRELKKVLENLNGKNK